MDELPRSFEEAVLDAMIDDDESPWVVHADLVREYGLSDAAVEDVIATMNGFVERGWFRTHHPEAPTDEFWEQALAGYMEWLGTTGYSRTKSYYMDYGPWYRLTNKGRKAWARRAHVT